MKFTEYKIPGYSQLLLSLSCKLHCKNCCVFDYKGQDTTVGLQKHISLEEVESFLSKMREKGISFTRLVTLGGEPTLNPEFKEISDLINNSYKDLYDTTVCHTNGLNLTEKVIQGLANYGAIHISIYPSNVDIRTNLVNSEAIKYLRSEGTNVIFKMYTQKRFYEYGTKIPGIRYDENNWDRCPIKNQCQYIYDSKIYGCNLMFAEKSEPCDLMTASIQEIHDYFERDIGYNMCKICWQPAKMSDVSSNSPELDKKAVAKGASLIRKFNQNTK